MAADACGIEGAVSGIFDDAVDKAVIAVAGVENGALIFFGAMLTNPLRAGSSCP
ncbi:MAG TPA: hypothetical protein VLL97_09100 [Acidobacteriota bacterium]|nr:hypothetical protein [Acidobacteriota bacterium]